MLKYDEFTVTSQSSLLGSTDVWWVHHETVSREIPLTLSTLQVPINQVPCTDINSSHNKYTKSWLQNIS